MTGETIGAGMSGAAIAQLQSQALRPVEELKESFWLVKEKQGKVMAQFFKLFYHGKQFRYREKIPEIDGEGNVKLTPTGAPVEKEILATDRFDGSAYENVDFEVVVEATSGTKASAAGDITVLDVLFSAGKISLKTYLNAYPKDALSNKSEILKGIEEDEQDAMLLMQRQVEQMTDQLERYAAALTEQEEIVSKVETVIHENETLRGLIAQLYTESREKIALANQIISAEKTALDETTRDAHDFAEEIVKREMQA